MNKLQSIALHQKSIYTSNADTLACMWKIKWYKWKKFRDTRLYKSSVRKKNNTLMSFTGVSFSNFFYDDNIGKYWMVSFKSCCSLIVCHLKLKYNKTIVLLSNKNLLSNIWTHWPNFSAPRFLLTSYFCHLKFKGVLVYASHKSSTFLNIL